MSVIRVKGLSKKVANQSLIRIKGMSKVSRGTPLTKLYQSCIKVVSKLYQSCIKVVSKLYEMCVKGICSRLLAP